MPGFVRYGHIYVTGFGKTLRKGSVRNSLLAISSEYVSLNAIFEAVMNHPKVKVIPILY